MWSICVNFTKLFTVLTLSRQREAFVNSVSGHCALPFFFNVHCALHLSLYVGLVFRDRVYG